MPKVIRSFTTRDKNVTPALRLALHFHQDFSLTAKSEDAVALEFIDTLNANEKLQLDQALESLLKEFPGKDQKGLRNAWRRLGAEWCGNSWDLRRSIELWRNWL